SAPGRSLSDALRLDARALRFHIGTSLADLRVPVHVDESVRSVVQTAVRDLFFLLSVRHRAVLRANEYDRLLLLDGFDHRAARRPCSRPTPAPPARPPRLCSPGSAASACSGAAVSLATASPSSSRRRGSTSTCRRSRKAARRTSSRKTSPPTWPDRRTRCARRPARWD